MTSSITINSPQNYKSQSEFLYIQPESGFSKKANLIEFDFKTKISFEKFVLKKKNIEYIFDGQSIGFIPEELSYLVETIDKSKYILDLQDNWDDEGSSKYDLQTWISAIRFLLNYSKILYEDFNTEVDNPVIYHAPKGSIDIMWEKENYRIVVNILSDGEQAFFYADNYKDQITEGSFKVHKFNHLLIPFAIQF